MRLHNDRKQLQELCNIFLQRNLHLDRLVCIVLSNVVKINNSVSLFPAYSL
jgi:hypothetical protein